MRGEHADVLASIAGQAGPIEVQQYEVMPGYLSTSSPSYRAEVNTDMTYLIKITNGTLNNFTADASGNIVARSVQIEPKDAAAVPLIVKDTLSTGDNWTEWRTSTSLRKSAVQNTGLLASSVGFMARNALVSALGEYVALEGTLDVGAEVGIYWGDTGDDARLRRTAASVLRFDDGSAGAVTVQWIGPGTITHDLVGADKASDADIATLETRNNVAYGDLTTTGPDVAFTVPPSGRVMVMVSADLAADAAGNDAWMSYQTTDAGPAIAATDGSAAHTQTADFVRTTRVGVHAGLTPGTALTVRAKYRRDGGAAASFKNRRLTVVPL